MSTLAANLKTMSLFSELSDAQRERIVSACRRRTYRGRVQLFYQGDPGGQLYFVLRGGVKIFTDGDGAGKETTLAILTPGDFFGEMALLTGGGRRTACAETIAEETELLLLDQTSFEALLRECGELTRELLRLVAVRLNAANEKLGGYNHTSLGRVCKLLLARADPNSGKLCPPMSQEELASFISVRRETVARNLARLEEAGCLRRNRGSILVTDRTRLERISDMN